jgi:hypothetical protein
VQARPPAQVPAPLLGSILGTADDRAGSLWIATTDRVLRVNRDHLELGTLGEGTCVSTARQTASWLSKA